MRHTAVYAGSFDPPTLGHIDIIDRASRLFETLIVAIGINHSKTPFLPVEERLQSLRDCLSSYSNVRVESFEGILVDFARQRGSQVILRGLRAITDFDYEFRASMANRRLAPEIETVFLVSREENSFLASSVVKEIATLGGNYRSFVPSEVVPYVERKLAELKASGARLQVSGQVSGSGYQ